MQRLRTVAMLLSAVLLGTVVNMLILGCQRQTATNGSPTADRIAVDAATPNTTSVDAPTQAAKSSAASGDIPNPVATGDKPAAGNPAAGNPAAGDKPAAGKPAAVGKPAAGDKSANAKIVAGDWNQWGGSGFRNNVPVAENIPNEWDVGGFDRNTGNWLKDRAKNIKWASRLGSQAYGNPVVADGRIFVGTNNFGGFLKRYPADIDLGVLLCFRESDGALLWQHSSEKLPTGRVHDWPLQGICCAPYVEGTRLWFVTSRGEVVCLDAEGFHDGEDDGPLQNELGRLFDLAQNEDPATDQLAAIVTGLTAGKLTPELMQLFSSSGATLPDSITLKPEGTGRQWSFSAIVDGTSRDFRINVVGQAPTQRLSAWKVITPADKDEADRIWVLDMMAKLQVSQHNMCSCSITALGDLLFVNTSNGVDETHIVIPQLDAPSFICIDKNTGEVYWTDKSPGENILHGQWSSPALAVLGGVPQVIFGGGDGWLYSFKADKGQGGKPEKLWEFDANPKETKYSVSGKSTRNHIIGTPVIYDGLVYVAVGEDPEHGEGEGHLWCIDPTKRGDVSAQLAVNVADRTKPLPKRRLQAIFPEQGDIAVDNPNSAVVWHFGKADFNNDGKFAFEEIMHRTCGSIAAKNDLLFIADFSGLFHCFDAKTGKRHWAHDMLAACWGSPLIAGDKVYIGDEDGGVTVFELSAERKKPLAVINMTNSVYTTPVVANGVLYIANRTHLFAIAADKQEK